LKDESIKEGERVSMIGKPGLRVHDEQITACRERGVGVFSEKGGEALVLPLD
jgi:hypothetical protein